MRNPFVEMALVTAAMAAQFRAAMQGAGDTPTVIHCGYDGSKRGAWHKRNPAGSKIARRFAKRAGSDWNGEIVHTGALTALNQARAARRVKAAA